MAFEIPDHPDLIDIGRRLQSRFDRVLETEHEAAAVLARRTATIRDRLLDAEDAESMVTVHCIGGHRVAGRVVAVAQDHIELAGDRHTIVAMEQLIAVDLA
jgi:hypothetical protein